ncbi:MAG: ATPase, T2SS/T4P/T4SS family [Pirellulaceae bacterium]
MRYATNMEAGDILLRRGLLDQNQLDNARGSNGDAALSVVDRAVDLGFCSEADALQAIGEELGLEFVDLTKADIDLSVLEGFPHKIIHRETLFPIGRQDGHLIVATSDPFHLYPIDEVSAATGDPVIPVLAPRDEIDKLIKANLGVGSETIDGLMEAKGADDIEFVGDIETDNSELSEMAQEASVVKLVNEILLEAIETRSSDVHLESQPDGLAIRYRVDGILHSQPIPPEINRFQSAIVSRLKIMSRLNIAEKRLPQDGRMKLKLKGREIDVRVSVIPMINGEGICLRILDKGNMSFDLRKLGMEEATYNAFSELVELPHGIILVTGPTGSGKTTTLYSALLQINRPETKIITTEDPVEYQLKGINQIQVHTKIGFTFAHSLRSILRHDPDVVLIGEIRDLETAENAVQASLTGHLVFSTLHTNDAAGAFARMTDMGVEPFLVASTLEALMAQRLVRRLCPECKQEVTPDSSSLAPDFPVDHLIDGKLMEARGCRACRQVGYSGRMGIYELLVNNDEIRELAHNRANTWDIKQTAVRCGMETLREDGWRKVLAGTTSAEEVMRVTKGDQLVASTNLRAG